MQKETLPWTHFGMSEALEIMEFLRFGSSARRSSCERHPTRRTRGKNRSQPPSGRTSKKGNHPVSHVNGQNNRNLFHRAANEMCAACQLGRGWWETTVKTWITLRPDPRLLAFSYPRRGLNFQISKCSRSYFRQGLFCSSVVSATWTPPCLGLAG